VQPVGIAQGVHIVLRSNHGVAALASRQRGLSVIELLVGVAIGMFIVGGAIKLFVDVLGNNRRLLVEARVNQDLRAAADIVARDLRRSGYWRNSMSGVPVAAATPASNPYGNVTFAATSVDYAYDKDGNASVSVAEQTGFRLTGSVIEMQLGGSWQAITDSQSVQVTNFSITNSATAIQWYDLAQHCECISRLTCTLANILALAPGHANRPQVGLRWADIVIEGRATTDSRVTRRLEESVRLRNDLVRGTCPA
jgi:prepilin peptidase dependent protein B